LNSSFITNFYFLFFLCAYILKQSKPKLKDMPDNNLRQELVDSLKSFGATLVGFADLRELPTNVRHGLDFGISIGVAIKPKIIQSIYTGPSMEYYEEYKRLNALLAVLADLAAEILTLAGYQARPQPVTARVIDMKNLSTDLPHKTVATRAGLGWIGKCALLVTEEYGSALRIVSVLTNADLGAGLPINSSRCDTCRICIENCPGQAPLGDNWDSTKPRDSFFNADICRATALNCAAKIGIKEVVCGRCIAVCPWTEKYLASALNI
jgi:epoxyqueuosine reductase